MDFEKIKKEFIVNPKEYSKEKLANLMSSLLEFVRVGNKGEVVVVRKVPSRKILKLILSARYVAHEAEDAISPDVSRTELESYSGLKKPVFSARISEVQREGFADKKGDVIRAKNILLIEKFVQELKSSNGKRN